MSRAVPNFSLLLLSILSLSSSSTTKLTRFLLSNHNPAAAPDRGIVVDYESALVHIIAIEERTQTITVLVHTTEEWEDASLSWKETQFNGVNRTWLPRHSVWMPDIIPFNMLERTDVLSDLRSTVKITSKGRVSISQPQIIKFMCSIRVSQFPFDSQECTLEIASWGYSDDKLRLRPVSDSSLLLQHYQPNEEWALTGLHVDIARYSHEDNVVSEVRLVISVHRKPLYFITSLLLPTYIICALSIVGLFARFSTRNERQERFTLGVTATLTLAVLSLVVTEKVPHTSEEIPVLLLYFHMNTLIITVATFLTSLSLNISRKAIMKGKDKAMDS